MTDLRDMSRVSKTSPRIEAVREDLAALEARAEGEAKAKLGTAPETLAAFREERRASA